MATRRPVKRTRTCDRCERALPEDDFHVNERLEGGRDPWCDDCRAQMREGGDDRAKRDHARDYQRLYHARWRKATDRSRKPRWRLRLARGEATVTLLRDAKKVRVGARWRCESEVRKVVLDGFRADPSSVALVGRGGGSGRGRRQPRFVLEADVDVAATEAAMEALRATRLLRRRS